jgi:outer membrane murein-binding lipoprotein Lpp
MRIMRRPRALVAVVAGCVLLAGCSSGPSQVGAAAIIGGNTASLDDVQAKLDKLVQTDTYAKTQAQQHKLDDLTRGIVSREVLYRLVDDAVQREKLPFDQKNVSAFLPDAQQQGTDDPGAAIEASVDKAFDPQDVAKHNLLIAELGLKYIGRVSLVADTVLLSNPTQALDLANRIAVDPSKSAQLMQQAGAPAGSVGLNTPVASTQAQSIQWDARPNSVVYQVLPASDNNPATSYAVAVVKQVNASAGAANPDPSTFTPQQLLLYGKLLLRPSAEALGIKVNPRYGEWNSLTMSVGSAAENAATGKIIAPQSSAP